MNAPRSGFSALAWRRLVGLCVGLVLVLETTGTAHAVPAFARKYNKSCQTCHVTYPKLTAFGEAFRRNGYRFPAGEDEDASEDEPVLLGQPAYKKVFPRAVWPGEVPGQVPLGVVLASNVEYASEEDPSLSFANVGGSLGLTFAGTLTDAFSGWAGAVLQSEGDEVAAELERVFAVVKPFDAPVLVVRVGRFEPQVSALTVHRTLGLSPRYLVTPVGDNQFTLDPAQLGIEANGVFGGGRASYAAGVVEGAGNLPNDQKDFYARASYKLGGMRLDGVGGATDPQPWREKSAQVGVFGYLGQATVGDGEIAMQGDQFYQAGADADLHWQDLNVIGVVAYGHNKRPSLDNPDDPIETYHGLLQTDYVVFPWLIPTVRYEWQRMDGADTTRISGGVYALFRANVRAQLLGGVALDGFDHYEGGEGRVGLSLAF